jgi:hypothetical protein
VHGIDFLLNMCSILKSNIGSNNLINNSGQQPADAVNSQIRNLELHPTGYAYIVADGVRRTNNPNALVNNMVETIRQSLNMPRTEALRNVRRRIEEEHRIASQRAQQHIHRTGGDEGVNNPIINPIINNIQTTSDRNQQLNNNDSNNDNNISESEEESENSGQTENEESNDSEINDIDSREISISSQFSTTIRSE